MFCFLRKIPLYHVSEKKNAEWWSFDLIIDIDPWLWLEIASSSCTFLKVLRTPKNDGVVEIVNKLQGLIAKKYQMKIDLNHRCSRNDHITSTNSRQPI